MHRKMLRALLPTLAAGALLVTGSGAAVASPSSDGNIAATSGSISVMDFQDSKHVGGGLWYFGSTDTKGTWSDYTHNSRCHGSSALGLWLDRDNNVKAGKKAHAWAERDDDGGNKAYWRHMNGC